MIFMVLLSTGAALIVCALTALITHRVAPYQASGMQAIGNALFSIADILDHSPGPAVVTAGCCAWHVHNWWRGGGGDGTRRRLRSLRRAFTAVRRTAPTPT